MERRMRNTSSDAGGSLAVEEDREALTAFVTATTWSEISIRKNETESGSGVKEDKGRREGSGEGWKTKFWLNHPSMSNGVHP
jgi:hypothetical protein